MGQLSHLEINEHEALEDRVVEHQIDVEVVAIKRDPLLPGHEGEALTQFQQKRLKVVDQSLLQMGFYKLWWRRKAEELHDDWIFEDIAGSLYHLPFRGQSHQTFLVLAQSKTLVQETVDLPFQIPGGPAIPEGLDLIERPGFRFFDAQQRAIGWRSEGRP